ncbi:uncharacterized protein LOC123209847 [Mangifera indica]|uniref:uncharacterized protein LOC123209847 n=1 Tax=Mangifera indica TaxID=29780 RepID=UPI001CFAE494|nr:uncharacterized protein LOC123209847 [Mangifera indica]
MAGIAIVLDLWRKNSGFCSPQTVHSSGFLSAAAAAASAASAVPFASRFLFGSPKFPVAYCDAGAAITDEYISNIQKAPGIFFQHDAIKYTTKEYDIQLKPLFSAFELRAFAMTSLRSFLMYYLPLLEATVNTEEDDEDFLQESQEERHVDLVVPFKKSVKQIARETTVVTTRRILERLAVHYVSQRTAWKLLKDAPKSAMRKAERGLPTFVYFVRVSRTTFRGHFLGVAASWIVQIGIEVYRSISRIMKSGEESDDKVESQEAKLLGKKVFGVTIRCGSSLVFASIGAGIGATIVRPSIGQWIGCAVGDLAGPIIVTFCLDKALHVDL